MNPFRMGLFKVWLNQFQNFYGLRFGCGNSRVLYFVVCGLAEVIQKVLRFIVYGLAVVIQDVLWVYSLVVAI